MYKTSRALIRLWVAVGLSWRVAHCQSVLASDGDVTPCGTQFTSQGTCTWTGAECPLTGCQETCVADLGVGLARAIVQDRAYGASWFQLCPRLAQIVHLVVDGSPGLTQSPQEAASPSAEISARLSGTAASSTGETSSRLLLAEATEAIDTQLLDLLLMISRGARSSREVAPQPWHSTRLLQDSGQSTRQTCPEPDIIDQTSTLMFALAGEFEDIFDASANGTPLSSAQQGLAYILDTPNEMAVIIEYMRNPEMLKEYMASSCATSPVPSSLFRFYDELLTDGTPPFTPEVIVCRDTFGGIEQHLQLLAVAGEECDPPFTVGEASEAEPECFATLQETPWSPTSEACAVALAAAYNISDAPLRAAAASMTSLHDLCLTSTSQDDCESMDGSPQRAAIQAAWGAFPLRADLPTAGSQAPTVEAATLTFADSPPTPDPDAQEVAAAPAEGPAENTSLPLVDSSVATARLCRRYLLALCHLVALLLLA